MSETNPFRQSMILRAESPLSESDIAQYNPFRSSTPSSQTSQTMRISPPSQTQPQAPSQAPEGNLSYGLSLSSAAEGNETLAPPPSYWETANGRRHSDSSLPLSDEKSRLQDHDAYREGYEEGLRRERERQIRRRQKAQQASRRHGNDSEHYGDASEKPRSSERRSGEHRSSGQHTSSSGRRRSKSESSKPTRRHRDPSLDVIDKMDVTGLFGPGTFHHDGPFDAATPARNNATRAGSTRRRLLAQHPPIDAFPMDGPNNSLAVVDPQSARYRTEEQVYGRPANVTMAPPETMPSFNPKDRTQPVHGQSTMGLGSSTFLDGTPASKDAIAAAGRERSESLGRSRSILRRHSTRRRGPEQPRHTFETGSSYGVAPSPQTSVTLEESKPTGLLGRVKSLRGKR